MDTPADSQAKEPAINSPLGPGPRQSMTGRISSSLAAQRQHQTQRTQTAASSAVNVLGSPFISCPINLPMGPMEAMQQAQQQRSVAAAVNQSNSCDLVSVPASCAVIEGNPFISTPVEVASATALTCSPSRDRARTVLGNATRRVRERRQRGAQQLPIVDAMVQEANMQQPPMCSATNNTQGNQAWPKPDQGNQAKPSQVKPSLSFCSDSRTEGLQDGDNVTPRPSGAALQCRNEPANWQPNTRKRAEAGSTTERGRENTQTFKKKNRRESLGSVDYHWLVTCAIRLSILKTSNISSPQCCKISSTTFSHELDESLVKKTSLHISLIYVAQDTNLSLQHLYLMHFSGSRQPASGDLCVRGDVRASRLPKNSIVKVPLKF